MLCLQLENFRSALEAGRSVQLAAGSIKPPPLLAATSFLHCFTARGHAPVGEDSGGLGKAAGTIYISKEVTEERRRTLGR